MEAALGRFSLVPKSLKRGPSLAVTYVGASRRMSWPRMGATWVPEPDTLGQGMGGMGMQGGAQRCLFKM